MIFGSSIFGQNPFGGCVKQGITSKTYHDGVYIMRSKEQNNPITLDNTFENPVEMASKQQEYPISMDDVRIL